MNEPQGWVRPARVRFGELWIDALKLDGALEAVRRLLRRGAGGAVFTPNVDHVVVASEHEGFRRAYARADVVLCDGAPLLWSSRLLGLSLPEKVSGSDFFLPLMRLAGQERLRVYLMGAGPGVVDEAAARLAAEFGVEVVGKSSPRIGLAASEEEDAAVAAIAATRPDLVLAFLGTPKGELWVDRTRARLAPAIGFSLGASLDFYVGRVRRAPAWMRRCGLEWLFRLLQEPRRLAYRYLVKDPKFALILLRTLLRPRRDRVLPPGAAEPVREPT